MNKKIRSPRVDPYSVITKTREKLEDQGYGEQLTIIDSQKLADGDGNHYLNKEVTVDLIYRHHPDNKGFNFREDYKEKVEFYALSIEGGKKGYIERHSRAENLDVVDDFLANVARNDSLSTHYY